MKKKKIFWLHSHTLMSTGGTRFIHEVTSLLSKKYVIELIVEKTSEEWRQKFQSSGVKVTQTGTITSTSLLYWAFFPYFILKNYVALKKKISKNDIVITTMFPFNALASILSNNHIYYCFEPFAFFYDKDLMRENGTLKYKLLTFLAYVYSWIDILGAQKAKLLLAINPSVGAYIQSIYSRKPENYSYLGVDTVHFSQKNVTKNKKVTFFHSTDYTPLKGTQYLIDALEHLRNEKQNFTIQVSESIPNATAKNTLIRRLKQLGMEKNVSFLGHLAYAELPKYYSKADIYLFLGNPASTGATAASLSVLEAQSCGLPVIRSIGNTDEIKEHKTGVYVDPRNSIDLANAMKDVIKQRKKYFKMAQACKNHVVKRYTWKNVSNTFIQSIESLK